MIMSSDIGYKLMIGVILILLCCLVAIYEAGLGILQVIGLQASVNVNHVITGSFLNPGPYGGLIAVLLSVLVAFIWMNRHCQHRVGKALNVISALSAALCVIVLPASMSRAAWLSFGVAFVTLGFREMGFRNWIREHRKASAAICLILLVVMTGVFHMKKDSAIGRFHIWHMELRAIAENPLTGTGRGSVLGTYGRVQAEYFAAKERSETIVRVAGCPEYAFNEYLKIGVEYGVVPMLAVIAAVMSVIYVLLRHRVPAAYGMTALAVFSFFSYPFSLIGKDRPEVKEWQNARMYGSMGLYKEFVEQTEPLMPALGDNYRFLYDYGYALHNLGRYEESIEVLEEGTAISSDPMFYNIIGKNLQALGRYAEAEKAFLHAHYMVPCRIYPLSLLMEMKVSLNDHDKALEYGRIIMSMPVNQRHTGMVRLQNEARECMDSLNVILNY